MKRNETGITGEPGDFIMTMFCPCCGAHIEILHGDEDGELAIIGTPTRTGSESEDETVERLMLQVLR